METALAKLRALAVIGLDDEAMQDVRWRNAARIFPQGALPGVPPPAPPRRASAGAVA